MEAISFLGQVMVISLFDSVVVMPGWVWYLVDFQVSCCLFCSS
jgi:hypothetical protein